MKKIIAVAIAAVMMIAMATTAFGLVIDTPATYKNPPVFVSGLAISDAWMSGLTAQNWTGSLTNQAYAEGSYIWFIAKIGVAANGDTDAQHLWDNLNDTAELTITGKDNCLNLTSANMATLAQISGMSVTARQIENSNLGLVEATENKALFTFSAQLPTGMDKNRVLEYNLTDLSKLQLDAIYGANAWLGDANGNITWGGGNNRATLQKDYYLHFMGITKAATEGVAVATMKVNGEDTFNRNKAIWGTGEIGVKPVGSYSTTTWYASDSTVGAGSSDTKLFPGDVSQVHLLYNTINGKTYSIMKICGEGLSDVGPYNNEGSIYVLMNKDADEFVIGFVVSGGVFRGLVTWNKDWRSAGSFPGAFSGKAWDAAYYIPLMSNDISNSSVTLRSAYGDISTATSELQAIFDFFGFAYANPKAPSDADFLARTGLVTVAEAKYNVANAVITTPDTNIVIPKTGDAATSTGLILVATAILAAAAVGFVLSKRSYN